MAFCPNCGTEFGLSSAKFCASCGSAVPQSTSTGMQQEHAQQVARVVDVMEDKLRNVQAAPRVIGITKELDSDERIVTQSTTQTEVIFIKEAQIKKMLGEERKEVLLSISSSMFYLTNHRLIFLKLFELSATELGQKSNTLAGESGTFYELPLTAITGVKMRPITLDKNDETLFINILRGDINKLKRPALEIIYDEKAATGFMLQRDLVSKPWAKVEMVYDKMCILGEQAVTLQPILSDLVHTKSSMR